MPDALKVQTLTAGFTPCFLRVSSRAQEEGEEAAEPSVERKVGDEINRLLTLRASAKIR